MEGGGELNDTIGSKTLLSGLFKNNLYNHENRIYLNPLDNGSVNDNYLKNQENYKVM